AGGRAMKALVSDALWEHIEPLFPPRPRRRFRFPGRQPLDYRKILTGILFVLKTGIAWENLPAELGCSCGKTCRHYLQVWRQASVWKRLHAVLLTTRPVRTRSIRCSGAPGDRLANSIFERWIDPRKSIRTAMKSKTNAPVVRSCIQPCL